mmetsp:Transcript_37411/g.88465  ORF Transcript_37411/g.88465 Transcript_37411/m.88465 type:complete len:414 (+) Transcript_37411:51-1292(+)
MADVRHATAGEPHQKAFGSADDSDDENQKPDQCNWGTSSSIAGTGVAGVLPEELRKRFPDHKDGRESVKKAIQEFCQKHSKSCSVIDKGCSKTVIFQCPFRHSVDDLKRKWKSKRQIHRPGAPAARTATEEENDGENREIVCPFHLIARFRSRGDLFFWEVDEEGAEPWHDGERCPSTHISPGWMISQHPEFLTAMMKAKKDRPNRPKLVKELASGKGGNRKLSVTTDQIRYAEKLYNEDLETGLHQSFRPEVDDRNSQVVNMADEVPALRLRESKKLLDQEDALAQKAEEAWRTGTTLANREHWPRFQELLKSVAEAREQSLSSEMESDTDRALVTYDAIVTHVMEQMKQRVAAPNHEAFVESTFITPQLKDCIFVGHCAPDLDCVAGAIGAAELFGGTPTKPETPLNGEIL